MRISDLRPAEYNPRKISEKRLNSLERAMSEFGDLSGIVLNVRSGSIVGGHQRVKTIDPVCKIIKNQHKDSTGTVSIGYIETPSGRWQYREVDWSEKKEKAANIAANKHGGEWDYPALKDILCDLDTGEDEETGIPYINFTGFDENELKELIDFDSEEKHEKEELSESNGKTCPNCGEEL